MKGFKRYQKSDARYWMKRNYSDMESEELAKKHIGHNRRGHYNFYIHKKITEDILEAKQLARQWIDEHCNLKREHLIKKFPNEHEYLSYKQKLAKKNLTNKRPSTLIYWLDLGYTKKEARRLLTNHVRKASKRCTEHWIAKGFSLKESEKLVSEYQDNTSLSSFVARHGIRKGAERYKQFCEIQKIKTSFNDVKKQSFRSKKRKASKFYWLNLEYSEARAIEKAKFYFKKQSRLFVEYWLEKGFPKLEAKKKALNSRNEFSKAGFKGNSHISKLEHSVYLELKQYFSIIRVPVKAKNRNYFPDMFIEELDIYLEIFGDYWHANPDVYKDTDTLHNNRTAKAIRKKDHTRIKEIEKSTGKVVKILWEQEIRNIGITNLRYILPIL